MVRTYTELGTLAAEWNELALGAGTPFMSGEWLRSWCTAYGDGHCDYAVLQDDDGSLRAATCVVRGGAGRLASTTNGHSPDWEILARDEASREELAGKLAHEGANRLRLEGMRADAGGPRSLAEQLERAGYRAVRVDGPFCPWLELPATWEELLERSSSSLRAQVRRRRRGLEREGELTFRAAGEPATLERDLEVVLELEASGWKGREGTAILSEQVTARLYRDFAAGAAEQGWLRLYFLELDGRAIAADYGCAFAGTGWFMKTGFDERYGRLSPGLVLRAEVLRASIEEGLGGYDFLGDPDTYKTRWTPQVRPRASLWAYRGNALPGYVYRKRLRPLLKSARNGALELRSRAKSGGGAG